MHVLQYCNVMVLKTYALHHSQACAALLIAECCHAEQVAWCIFSSASILATCVKSATLDGKRRAGLLAELCSVLVNLSFNGKILPSAKTSVYTLS